MLIPDHGTTPMRRRTERRTHVEFSLPSESESISPPRAERVMSKARGKKYVKNGARGFDKRVAQTEPIVVKAVKRTVARAGEKRTPARTF
jgi:hypothetical protein